MDKNQEIDLHWKPSAAISLEGQFQYEIGLIAKWQLPIVVCCYVKSFQERAPDKHVTIKFECKLSNVEYL